MSASKSCPWSIDSLVRRYFASRPEIFGNSDEPTTSAATSAAHRALASNPDATSSLISAGLRQAGQGLPKSSPYASAVSSVLSIHGAIHADVGRASQASNPDISNAVGRMGAASISSTAPSLPTRRGTAESPPPPTTSSTANLKSVRVGECNL